MSDFNYLLIFVAPFVVLIISIVVAFWVALRDKPVRNDE